jgi:hypothetical protein
MPNLFKNNVKNKFQTGKWLTILFIFICILLASYTFYMSEIILSSANRPAYIKYYFVSFVGVVFFIIILQLREELRINITIICCSLILGLYIFEGVLYSTPFANITNPDPRARAAKKLGISYDVRSKRDVIKDLIEQGDQAVPVMYPSGFINDNTYSHLLPLSGVSNKQTVYSNESGSFLIYESDRYGFHNPDKQWEQTQLDWLLVGDSFAHGSAVMPGEELASQIRLISKSHAISIGMGGNGPLLEYASLIEYGEALRAKKVVWFYYEGNDLVQNLKNEQENLLLMRYLENDFSQNLINRQNEIDDVLMETINNENLQYERIQNIDAVARWMPWLELTKLRKLLKIDTFSIKKNETIVDIENPLFKIILASARSKVEAWGGELYFVYLPQYERYSGSDINHDKFRNKVDVIELVQELNIPVLDAHQAVFSDHADPLSLFPMRLNGHYTADGYSAIARFIIEQM